MVVATSLLGFITKAFSAFSRIERPHIAWTSVTIAIFALLTCAYVSPSPASATAGINRQINFQGRLLNSNGATVPDGFYNIQFKIYQDGDGLSVGNTTGSPAGTLMWTESHLNANSQGVTVKNGFLSVQLGSINAFANQIDWNQDTIWLSMNIGNTNASCTPFSSCSPDGEMVPMKRMTATPYALNSGLLNGLTSSNFVQLAQGVQTDASAGPSSIFINKTAAGNLLQLQSSGEDALTISNAGDLTFGAAADHTISIATAAASTAGKTLTLVAGAGGSGTGSAGGDLVIQGGAAGGTDGNGGNLTINAGAKTGTGTDGTISIGTANTSGLTLGSSTTTTALSGNSSSTISFGGTTVDATELNRLDGKTAALVDTDDAVNTAITGVGTIGTGTWQGTAVADTYVADDLTIGSSGNVDWTALTSFPAACAAGSAITQLDDTITCSSFATGTAASYIQNQSASAQTTADFWISGNGRAGGSLTADVSVLTPLLDAATSGALAIGTTNATSIELKKSTVITGDLSFESSADRTISINASAAGTAGKQLTLTAGAGGSGSGSVGGTAILQGGVAGGTNGNGGNVVINAGAKTGTGTDGTISIGTANASSIGFGNSGAVLTLTGNSSSTFVLNGVTLDTTELNRLDGKTAALVDTDDAVNTAITGVGTIAVGTWQGTAVADTYVADNLTIDGTGSVDWTALNNYPAACAAGSALTQLGDTITCSAFATGTSASYIQNQFASAQTTTDFWISGTGRADTGLQSPVLDSTGILLTLGGSNATSISVVDDIALTTGRSLTVNGDAFTDLTGSGLTVSSGALTVDASSATGFFRNGGNSFGTGATLGTNDTNDLTLRTNGTTRATFDQSNNLYLGNGTTNASPSNFVVQATGNSGTGAGASLTIQAGSSGASANGANLTLSGGTSSNGVNGLVILSTPTFQNAGADANCYTGGAAVAGDCTIHASSVNNYSSIIVGFSASGKTATLPDPAITTPGRIVYIIGANGSSDFTLSVNGGVFVSNLIALRANASATMVWNGSDWTAAGASSSTTLQAAYDNTLQSSGGAELLVSKTANTNGLTIRDSAASPVNGAVLSVQSSSAAGLLSVNSNLTEYASNAGAETKGASDTTFPASTWSSQGSSTVTRNITTNNDTIATGQGSVAIATTASDGGAKNQLVNSAGSPLALTANNHYNVSFAVRLPSNASTTFTDLKVDYSADGTTGTLTSCTTLQSAAINVWTKINCSFTAPASGITTGNVIMIRQAGSTARTFYVDNLSVTIAADYNLTTDGGADNSGGIGNSGSNWDKATFGGSPAGTLAQDANDGQAASTSAKYTSVPATAKVGIRNKLAINPLPNTLYRVTVYAKSSNAFSDFMVRYTATTANSASDGDYVNCQDYNTRSVSTSAWTKITCYIKTTATTPTTSYLYFVQETGTARNFAVDTASITLSDATTPNVQVGGGTNGGPTTLFTLDRGASAPIAGDNDALLGSMYYDTTLGKLQCYEADGWGACGSSPDNIITISPEYTNAVMHGTGVGTMISDICSDFLDINDGSSGQSTICSTNETYNFYNWTSPQATSQTYSIYVTYQLPNTFKSFTSGSTSLQGRVSSTSNASINYAIYKNTGSSMTQCGSNVNVASGAANTWETKVATGAADPSACSFAAGNSIIFKISMSAKSNANAYIGNIGFTFSNN